ncbi:hypothetical protein [Tenacibaculum sp.]|uniref:hypothetical protein n=1 Tax=Tenacibaculum sp. TaxID=1906242 RepID=UPI003AA7C8BA
MLEQDHYQKLNLKYNPFSFLNDQELLKVTEERINLNDLALKTMSTSSCFIEFYGKKGKGKSTLLQSLHSKHLANSTFFKLKKKEHSYINTIPGILIIDSFQLLSTKNKLELLTNQNKLIIGAHYSHKIPYFPKRKLYKKINFSKLELDINLLRKIVHKRIELACLDSQKESIKIKDAHLQKLLEDHGNNLREIQLSLYDFFLNLNNELYELSTICRY